MEETIFWKLIDEIAAMGNFVAAVPNTGASANIVGRLHCGYDGREKVLEKEKCHCHVHLYPEQVAKFSFTYRDAGFGQEPCLEVLTSEGQVILRLYYHGGNAKEKYNEFLSKNAEQLDFVTGLW